jgi:inosine/xanthosine triphosphate pyrophosphatase family protein
MKKALLPVFAFVVALGFSSCKKCSTCTFKDPVRGTLTSEDVCQKGKAYDHVLEQYDNNGWSCSKK